MVAKGRDVFGERIVHEFDVVVARKEHTLPRGQEEISINCVEVGFTKFGGLFAGGEREGYSFVVGVDGGRNDTQVRDEVVIIDEERVECVGASGWFQYQLTEGIGG